MADIPFLASMIDLSSHLRVVDIGANPINEMPPYRPLLDAGLAEVVGFEPNPEAFAQLEAARGPHERYLPVAVGDGQRSVLRVCTAPGMTSLLPPNAELLSYFHAFPFWGRVVKEVEVDTVRLDDIDDITGIDYLKIDIQGAELTVMKNGVNKLKDCVVIHTEVNFLPFYAGQPLFAEVDQFIRQQGYVLHTFTPLIKRTIAPLSGGHSPDLSQMLWGDHAVAVQKFETAFGANPFAGLNQVLWTDAVFVRDFTRLAALTTDQVAKYALVMHDMYGSYDLTLLALKEYDRRIGSGYASLYVARLADLSDGAFGDVTAPRRPS